jgi:predicted RND superfamily exporter protein
MIVSATSAAYITNLLVNGFTLISPSRRSWVAFGVALLIGIVATFVLALATLPADQALTRQDYAQMVIVGIFAAGGAAGSSVTQASATAKREQATARTSEPDPVTPLPGVKP